MQAAELAAALAAAMARRTGVGGRVQNLRRLTGGATKQTWSFDFASADACSPLILQRLAAPVSGNPGKPDQARAPKLSAEEDARLMIAAHAQGVPAPVVRLILGAEDGLGQGYVTERVEGETLGRRIVRDPGYAVARTRMTRQCGQILAAIHRLPSRELPFLACLSPADELAVYSAFVTGLGLDNPALAFALRWTRENLPSRWSSAVVHADFRTGNLIVGPDDGIRCVLDWEIARIGDPMQDLGVLCMRTWRFGGPAPVGGFGSREELYAAYADAGGAAVDPERVRFWEAFSNMKWAIACLRRGLATTADGQPASVELCAIGRRLEEPLWDFFELIETSG